MQHDNWDYEVKEKDGGIEFNHDNCPECDSSLINFGWEYIGQSEGRIVVAEHLHDLSFAKCGNPECTELLFNRLKGGEEPESTE